MKPLLQYPCCISILIFSVITLVISINIPTSLGEDDSLYYTNCSNAFTCEGSNIETLKYPFFGGNRVSYCGQPGLDLICEDSAPKMSINTIKYRILDWDNTTQKLTVARDDYYSGSVCTVIDYKNTTFDNTLFQIQYDGGFVTLLYGCTSTENFQNQNPYRSDCGENKTVYYVLAPLYSPLCSASIVIPILGQQVSSLVSSNRIDDALKQGFELSWTGDYRQCTACIDSGGECGYDSGEFRCFCKDGPHTSSCHSDRAQDPRDRPDRCGHPLLHLTCEGNISYITIKDVKYKVLEANPKEYTLRITRVDYLYFEGLCPSKLVNTTLDTKLFVYGSDSEYKNLTLFYGCPASNPFSSPAIGRLPCFTNGGFGEFVYTQFGSLGPPLSCKQSVVVPVAPISIDINDFIKTQEAIRAGFIVRWIEGIEQCENCKKTGGGVCGYDGNSNQTTCYHCNDQSCSNFISPDAIAPPGLSKDYCQ
ncbi:Wall-associated receptor kinase, C-terminal [Sesbania bispinosa]|nr:Wall-associated receptor kinase, C-terminal [Sesbania bispinosa]